MTEGKGRKGERVIKGEPFFPHQALREAFTGTLLVAGLVLLATFLPAPLLEEADPFVTPSPIFPEWYFLSVFGFLKFWVWDLGPIPAKLIGVVAPGLIVGLIFLLPFIDRGPERHPAKRPLATGAAVVVLLMALYFAYYAIKITLEHAG
jgi:menaquinol-cytochrome c reductase cytochrome b/c subunit